MFIGTFLCAAGFVYLLTLFLGLMAMRGETAVGTARQLTSRFTLRSFLLIIVGLIAFIGLSAWRSIVQFGVAHSFSIPQDYINAGLSGWLILLIGIIGIMSPIILWQWTQKSYREKIR
jgi:hypothetical protein